MEVELTLMSRFDLSSCSIGCFCSLDVTLEFYLIMNVAVGGTNGWFPEAQGNKPWLNGSPS